MCSVVFFKQKTAYEMRISDWSSAVCSSDLGQTHRQRPCHRTAQRPADQAYRAAIVTGADLLYPLDQALLGVGNRAAVETLFPRIDVITAVTKERSEERSVGKEGVRTCRSRWSPYQ